MTKIKVDPNAFNIPKIPELINNQVQNPYSNAIELFLQTQLHLDGLLSVTEKLQTKWTIQVAKGVMDIEGNHILFKERYKFRYNLKRNLSSIKGYMYNILLAQSVEALETLLSTFVSQGIRNIKINDNIQFRKGRNEPDSSNARKIRSVLSYINPSGKVRNELVIKLKIFIVLEQVRHRVVHSDQLIRKSERNAFYSRSLLKRYFTLKRSGSDDRILVSYRKAQYLNRFITQFGFELFNHVCVKRGLPIIKA